MTLLALVRAPACRRNPVLGEASEGAAEAPSEVLPLPLLVPRILADDPHDPAPLDDLAVLAAHLDRRSDFHRLASLLTASPRLRLRLLNQAAARTPIISSLLLEPVRDPAPCEVVRRQLDLHAVPRQDADEVHAHLAAHVREHAVAALQLHAEHRVGQRLHNGALDLDRVFFGHAPLTPPGRSGPSGSSGPRAPSR